MKINLGERLDVDSIINQHNERRKKIIENYKSHLPHIENYIYYPTLRNHKFSFLTDQIKEINVTDNSFKLFKTIVDIRNNLDAVSPDSNCIIKTDNKYSNQTKSIIKTLLRKGWTYNEVVFELERIYGSGILSTSEYLHKPLWYEYVINTGGFVLITLIGMKVLFKSLKYIKRFGIRKT